MEKRGLASPCCLAGRPLINQPLSDQLLHQNTNYATGHLNQASEIGARNRLMLADQIKGDVTIYVARGRPRSHVKISGVDFSHQVRWGPVLFELRTISPDGKICQDNFQGALFVDSTMG